MTWVGLYSIIFDFGFNELIVRQIALNQSENKKIIQNAFIKKSLIIFLASVLLFPLMLLLYGGKERVGLVLVALVAAVVRSLCDFTESLLISLGEYRSVFQFAILQSLVGLSGGVILTQIISSEAKFYIISQAVLGLAVLVPRLVHLNCGRLSLNSLIVEFRNLPTVMQQCVPFGVMSVAASLSVSTPIIYLSLYGHCGEIAPMQAAVRIWTTLLSFGAGPFTRLLAVFSREKGNQNNLNNAAKLSLFWYNLSGFIICLIAIVFGKYLFLIFYTSKLDSAFPIFKILIMSLPFAFMAMVPGAWLPANMGEKLKMAIVLFFCLLMFLLLFQGRSVKNADQCAQIVSIIWILQSICFMMFARFFKGMPLSSLGFVICPSAPAIMLFGDRICTKSLTAFGCILGIGSLLSSWSQIKNKKYENN